MQTFQRLFETDFTYLRAFLRNVARYHQRIAVTCTSRQRSWTYAELNREGNRLARALLQDGVGPHDVVMGVLYNTAEFAFCWIGVQKAGGIFSPINFRLAEGEIALHIDDSAPKVLVYDSDVADVVHRAVKRANRPPARLVMVGPGQASAGATLYATYTQDMSDEEIDTGEKGPYDEIVRLYTSGTTGEP
ncbi:MAG TPA: class I adenylate-forming enzyme family protein, partial [Candidatus Sulfotelmatobacter sp.]|nr:class I adenylate-forming enzyme family protein [Candidatus Sulfotelmatobacter sp.]